MTPAPQGPIEGWTDAAEALLDQALGRLEGAWRRDPPRDLAPFVPPRAEPARRRVLIELIKVDQEFRWRRGDRRLVESYLREWPELADDPDAAVELLGAEYLTRSLLGALPDFQELRARFPDLYGHVPPAGIAAAADADAEARHLAERAVELARQASRLAEAGDLMEAAINQSPELRERYEYQLRLWRRGVVM